MATVAHELIAGAEAVSVHDAASWIKAVRTAAAKIGKPSANTLVVDVTGTVLTFTLT